MKDYVKILESSKKASFQKIVTVRGNQKASLQWNALNLIEDASERMKTRLEDILDGHLTMKIPSVKLDLFEKMGEEPRLMVKAQLYSSNSKEILLKVFVHEVQGQGKTKKLAKAIYHIELVNQQSGRRVA